MQAADPEAPRFPAQVTLRVLVKGASLVQVVAPPGGPRSDFNFGRWLEPLLAERGLPTVVRNTGLEGQKVTTALHDWKRDVQMFSPDVIIVGYGAYECIPRVLPRWFGRYVNDQPVRPGPVRSRWRRWIVHPLWRRLIHSMRYLDRGTSPMTFRVTPARVSRELSSFIWHSRRIGSPLVFVIGCYPAGAFWDQLLPRLNRRIPIMHAALAEMVQAFGTPEVRLFDVARLLEGSDAQASLPDGMHFSPSLHRRIGECLASEIAEWAAAQPHLQPRTR